MDSEHCTIGITVDKSNATKQTESQVLPPTPYIKSKNERDCFDIADDIIAEAYPDVYKKGKGWWGATRIPNWGILRGAIARVIQQTRKESKK